MTIRDIKIQIWAIVDEDISRVEAAIKFCGPKKDTVEYWQRVLHRVQNYKPKRKAPPKPKLTPEQIKRYRDAKYTYEQQEYIHWIADGHFIDPDMPNTATGNGLTEFIVKFLNWSGHRATRITTEGRVLPDGKRIPTQTRKGTADISATINGKAVMLEVKAGSDRPSQAQIKEQARERKAGGVYEFIHNVGEFFDWYDRFVIFG